MMSFDNLLNVGRRENVSSFVIGDDLYIYGGSCDGQTENSIFKINFNFMTWKKLEQDYVDLWNKADGDVYKNHFFMLVNSKDVSDTRFADHKGEVLCCLNTSTYSWSSFAVGDIGVSGRTGNLVIYKNQLLVFGEDDENGLSMSILNLEST